MSSTVAFLSAFDEIRDGERSKERRLLDSAWFSEAGSELWNGGGGVEPAV